MQLSLLSDDGEVIHFQCEGDITLSDFQEGKDPFQDLLGPAGFGRKVLLNLQKTTYIDSSGIGWLIVHHKHFRQAGGRLVLHSVPARVNEVFQTLRLSLVLNIAEDEQAARARALKQEQ